MTDGPERAEPDELAARLAEQLAATLDDDPAYERYGVLETSPWGSGQWMRYTDPGGRVHYLRIVVEPHRPG
jgi:hypothetical protein